MQDAKLAYVQARNERLYDEVIALIGSDSEAPSHWLFKLLNALGIPGVTLHVFKNENVDYVRIRPQGPYGQRSFQYDRTRNTWEFEGCNCDDLKATVLSLLPFYQMLGKERTLAQMKELLQ